MVLDNTSESVIVDSFVVDSGLLVETPAVATDVVKPSVCVDVIISTLVVATVDVKGSLVDVSSTVVSVTDSDFSVV